MASIFSEVGRRAVDAGGGAGAEEGGDAVGYLCREKREAPWARGARGGCRSKCSRLTRDPSQGSRGFSAVFGFLRAGAIKEEC